MNPRTENGPAPRVLETVAPSSPTSGSRAASTLDTLLVLSRTLAGAKQGGVLSDALDLLLTGVGCSRGAAYTAVGDALELVGERGLPGKLRAPLERLPLTGKPWFAAQRAAETRKLVADRDLAATEGSPLDRRALALARWGQVVACPIASGREVYGVLVFAWPVDEEPYFLGLAVIEIACNMMAIQMARLRRERQQAEVHRGDARAERMATLGIVATGLAEELDGQLAEVLRRLIDQQRILDTLRPRLAAREGAGQVEARAATARDPAEALRPARETTARFLSAIQASTPERLDLGALIADVLALVVPYLRPRRIAVKLDAAGEHFVVGRRSELVQLFIQLVLSMAGVLDDSDDVYSDRSALIPRSFALGVHRQGGHEVVSLSDAGEDGTGARTSFFEIGAHGGDPGFDLAAARQIVIAHEGHIEIGAAGAAGGTQCTVVLPAAGAEAERRPARSRLALGSKRPLSDRPRAVVIWIDEDDLFLEIMVQSLPDLDIRVARNAAEATQLLAFCASPALVLCNVRLPDRAGHDLHAEIARQSPRVAEAFAFVADGVVTPDAASYLIASGRPTLMRPIDFDQVRALAQRDPATARRVAVTAPTLADVHQDSRRAQTVPFLRQPEPSDGDREALPPAPVTRDAPPAAPPDPRDRATARERPQLPPLPEERHASAPAESPGRPGAAGESPSSMRGQELAAIARATAETVRREGPKRGGTVISMLRERGLSEPEALSVVTFALSTGILVRDPPPSAVLRVPDGDGRKSVLVVDDDFDLRQTLRDVLEEEGFTVETAANGREALDLLRRSNPPRVMVLDLMMPVMDGWQLLDELQRDESLADVPVVVISAGKAGVRAHGAHEFISKPIDYYKLVTTLERSMKRA